MTDPAGFTFAIPVKPRAVSSDWALVQRNLRATVTSVLGSESPAFRIMIAAHDPLELPADDRIGVLRAEFRLPVDPIDGGRDKKRKRRMIGAALRAEGYRGYIMFLDADDLIHRALVRYVQQDDNRQGYVLRHGYRLDARTGKLGRRTEDFDKQCGSCFAAWFETDELPRDLDDTDNYFSRQRHTRCVDVGAEQGRAFQEVPFPAAVYVMNHDESLRMLKLERARSILGRGGPAGRVILRRDFNFDPTRAGPP